MAEFAFGTACDRLSSEPLLDSFNRALRTSGQSLFDARDRSRGVAGGFARELYGDLCNYSHSRPGFAEGDRWSSNGPVYVHETFREWHCAWLNTVSLCAVLILIARPRADRRGVAALFTDKVDIVPEDLRHAFAVAAA